MSPERAPDARPAGLFPTLVAESGLAPLFAAPTVRRALSRAGIVDAESVTPAEATRALPVLKQALAVYLPPGQVEARMRAIVAALAR